MMMDMRRYQEICSFLLASFLLAVVVYQDALVGKSLLAPLDIGPDVFGHFEFMDPEADRIPANHFISDQFVYDLPLQKVIWDSYRAGEIPWWDPFTYGGRPLLADAHINGTDPIRVLCYLTLPFELAYNWNFVIRGVLTGLGMFLLLRTLGVRFQFSVILSLVYSYAGWFMLFFGHPWIAGSFLYYPYLWLVWSKADQGSWVRSTCLGGILCAGVFYAGNLQSHLYLPTFAGLFLGGKMISERCFPWRLISVVAMGGVLGAMIASPVLWNQLEFFLINDRPVTEVIRYPHGLLNPAFLIAGIFPWGTGTFRTLSVGSLIGNSWISYVLFAGSVVSLLAAIGFFGVRNLKRGSREAVITSRIFVIWLLLMSMTPLLNFYYLRSGAIAGMGVIVLAGVACEGLAQGRIQWSKRWLVGLMSIFVLAFVSLQIVAFLVYPRVKGRVTEMVERAIPDDPGKILMPELRTFQIDQFINEVSVKNPETTISALAIGLFLVILWRAGRGISSVGFLSLVLVVSSIPLVSFYLRFRPKHDIVMWERLLEGGPAQHAVKEATAGGKRFDEDAKVNAMVLPFAYPAFYGVNAVRGYSALQPSSIVKERGRLGIPEEWQADVVRASNLEEPLSLEIWSDGARIRTEDGSRSAGLQIKQEGLNRMRLECDDQKKNLLRTDTFFPGWEAEGDSGIVLSKVEPCFTKISGASGMVELRYRPTSLKYTPYLAGGGLGTLILLLGISRFQGRTKDENDVGRERRP